jgi:hypothetical protein
VTTLTGILRDSGGNPITGTLWLEISQAGTFSPGAILVTPLQPSVFTLTAGSISGPGGGPYSVYGNDGITPSVTFYRLTAFDAAGSQVLRLNVNLTGASVDMGAMTIAPTQSWVSPPGYILSLGGDVTGPSTGATVTKIQGKSVLGPPWTPGHLMTVQPDGSLALVALAVQDKGGQVFNVKAYGATGNGSTDDTAAINATIAAAAAVTPRGVVFFPPGTYLTTGGHDLNGLSGLSIVGSGQGSTVFRLGHATNDLFSIGATVTANLVLRDFSVTSDTVTRTGGWVFHVNNAYNGTGMLRRSYFGGLELRKQFNGLGIKKYEFVMAEKILVWDPASSTTGVGLQAGQATSSNINQGSELHLSDVQIYGNDLAGGSPYFGSAFRIEDCDAVYMARCGGAGLYGKVLNLVANSGGHTPANHFFMLCAFDATKTGPSCHVGGTGSFENLQWNGCWFASAGKLAGGTASAPAFLVDCTGAVTMSKVTDSTFYASAGNGLRVASSNHVTLLVEGNTFSSCGTGAVAGNRAGIYVSVPTGYLAPSIVGNLEANSGLYSLETAATATKVWVTGNKFLTAVSYGVAPETSQFIIARAKSTYIAINATGLVDIPSATVTFTPPINCRAAVMFGVDASMAVADTLIVKLVVNGTVQDVEVVLNLAGAGSRCTATNTTTVELTAGTSYTIKLQAAIAVAGNYNVFGPNSGLTVVAIGPA